MPINPDAQAIINACENSFAANSGDCNRFCKAVLTVLKVVVPAAADADGIVDFLSGPASGWTALDDGDSAGAAAAAEGGFLVVAGLRGAEHVPARAHGHVAIVVAGPPDANGYPRGYWGSIEAGVARKNASLRKAWRQADADNLHYFKRTLL